MLMLAYLSIPLGFAFPLTGGVISGAVHSQDGAAISGAKVTLTDENTSSSQSLITARTGEYSFADLSDGVYTLTVTTEGFEPASRAHVAISGDHLTSLDFKMVRASTAGAKGVSGTDAADPLSNRAGYYDDTPLKPSDVHDSVDAGGYSTPGQARATTQLIHGVAAMKSSSGNSAVSSPTGSGSPDPRAVAAREAELKKTQENAPRSFEANHELGEFYLRSGKPAAGILYLDRAERLDPSHYDNGYDLALAYLEIRNPVKAREQLTVMIARQDNAGLHNLLGDVEEAAGNYAAAVNEYERAARMDPSEGNILDWGSELLLHQAFDPAIEVFTGGVSRYPRSATLLIGQGVALYSRGRYDDAIKALCAASDISPADPRPYLFLGKMYNVSTAGTDEVTTRLERFVKLDPNNAIARFDYAMSVWKGQRGNGGQADLGRIEALLKGAIAVDPKFPDAHFELGNLYSEQKKYPEAIEEYLKALAVQPDLVDAHYRLAQAYTRTGNQTRAQHEFELHDRLRKQQLGDRQKNRTEIQQFVSSVKGEGKQ